jgi:hypothetical protein
MTSLGIMIISLVPFQCDPYVDKFYGDCESILDQQVLIGSLSILFGMLIFSLVVKRGRDLLISYKKVKK